MVAKGEPDRLPGSNGSLRNVIGRSHSAGVKEAARREKKVEVEGAGKKYCVELMSFNQE